MAAQHVLTLIKIKDYEKGNKSSTNPYIPQIGYAFYHRFVESIADNAKVSLIYFASNGPYIMSRKETKLPTKDWNVTIITKHKNAIAEFQQSKVFNQMKREFCIECVYNVPFKMNNERIDLLQSPKIKNVILSRSPPTPYPTSSYEWLSKDKNAENMPQIIKFVKYKDQPFLMLNMMQIFDENADKLYSKKAGPLIWGIGGSIPMVGNAKCVKNNYWTELVMVYYPNTAAFWNMLTSNYYMDIEHIKLKSTKDVFLQMTIPMYCHPKYKTFGQATTAKL